MTPAEIACYSRYLVNARSLLEYGVGGSTVLAASLGVGSIYSVESDAAWIRQVARQPEVAAFIEQGRAKLTHVDIGPTGKWGYPTDRSRRADWAAYACKPWRDGIAPDLVLVDGRFRVSCAIQSLLHGKPDILIAVHDFWRGRRRSYRILLTVLSIVETAGHLVVLRPRTYARPLAQILARLHAHDPS